MRESMNKYWSNEDDEKVSYPSEYPQRDSGPGPVADAPARRAAPRQADDLAGGAFSANQGLDPRENRSGYPDESAYRPSYGPDRSSFIAEELNDRQRGDMQFAPPPRFSQEPPVRPPEAYAYGEGYQVRSEHPRDGGGRKRGWLTALVIVLALLLIGCGAYIFRDRILDLVGNIFGEEAVWKIVPTPAPTQTAANVPAYVKSSAPAIKTRAAQEIDAVADGVDLETDTVTDRNIVMRSENQDGTYDYYLFAYDNGRLLGYYEGLLDFVPCAKDIFYIAEDPYLITSRGFSLVDPDAFTRSAGGAVRLKPMIFGWAMVTDARETMLNFVGEDGDLISDLWFAKAFPFTADTTLAYVDTGNVTDSAARYALYLLKQDGETKRLNYTASMDGVLECVCGMAFMANGDLCEQDEALTRVAGTDDAAAYVNCGALVVRDPETKLYGLFTDGAQQYPFSFDSIEPMPSDLVWAEYTNGYIRRYAVEGETYPLPRSYSFILKSGDTEQIVSIAAVSEYPIVFD
jgi:hypothetical protein